METRATLTGIYLEGFQSLQKPTFIGFEKLTFLYGPNSAGKSAIHDAMALLKVLLPPNKEEGVEDFVNGALKRLEPGTRIGIQFLLTNDYQSHPDLGFNPIESWKNTRNANGDYTHRLLLKFLGGKRISVVLGSDELHIMVDDCSFLRLSLSTRFLPKGNRLLFDADPSSVDEFDELFEENGGNASFASTITINCQSPLYNNTDWDDFLNTSELSSISSKRRSTLNGNTTTLKSRDAIFARQFVSRDSDTIAIHGLLYDFTSNTFTTEPVSNISAELKKPTPMLDALRQALVNFGIDLTLLMDIIRHLASKALDNSHVRGDRQVITSRHLYTGVTGLAGEHRDGWTDPYGMYNRALNEEGSADSPGFRYSTSHLKSDFVGTCMSRLLPSLKGYQIVPQKGSFGEYRLAISNRSGKVLDFSDVGSGISYIFPILVSLWAKRLSFIEQPELHLHPAAQCELGDVFIAAANEGSSGIIESHSEHILLRILRRIKETTNQWLLPPDLAFSANDIVIYYFKPDETGSTTVKEIRVDKYGEFTSRWPDGFFSERERELFPEYYASKQP